MSISGCRVRVGVRGRNHPGLGNPQATHLGGAAETERTGDEMGKAIVMNGLTLDGVMQGPGRPNEDTRDGFAYGGWAVPYSDEVMVAKMGERMGGDRAFLFGRRTYEDLLASWNAQGGPFKEALNNARKYVASSNPATRLDWPNSTLLHGDIPAAVADLKERSGTNLVIMGSGVLIGSLMAADLTHRGVGRHIRARSRIGDQDELLGPGSGRPPSAWLEEGGAHERSEHEPSWGFALPVSLPPKLRVTGGEDGGYAPPPADILRVLSSWVHRGEIEELSGSDRRVLRSSPIPPRCRNRRCGPVGSRRRRRDVLVQAEQVRGVVPPLDLGQPVECGGRIGLADPLLALVPEEPNVRADVAVAELRRELVDPGPVHGGFVGPLVDRGDADHEPSGAVGERRGVGRDPGHRPAQHAKLRRTE